MTRDQILKLCGLTEREFQLQLQKELNLDADDPFCNAYELSGGNYDDAWSMGGDEARYQIAKAFLKHFNL